MVLSYLVGSGVCAWVQEHTELYPLRHLTGLFFCLFVVVLVVPTYFYVAIISVMWCVEVGLLKARASSGSN